jgi:hypothetical protein
MGMHIPTSFHGNKFMGIREVMRSYFIPGTFIPRNIFFSTLITNMGIVIP